MGFMGKIKEFLVRWDLMPILWPSGEGGWIVPAIMGGSALISAIAGKKKADAANKANLAGQQAYNDWLAQRQSGVNDLISRLQGQGWNPFGVNELSGSNWGTSSTSGNESQQMRKVVDAAQRGGYNKLNQQVFGRLGTAAVSPSEQIRAVKAINDTFENAMQGARDMAGIRGVGPVAGLGASQGVNAQRASQIANYLGSEVPKEERRRQLENEQVAQGLINMMLGSNTNRQYSSLTNQMGGQTNQVAPNMTALANLMLPPSPQAPMQTGTATGWGAIGDLAGAAGSMAAYYQGDGDGQPQPASSMYSPRTGITAGPPIATGTYWGHRNP